MEEPSLPKDRATESTGEFDSLGDVGLTGGRTIGHYRIIRRIGQGGMGTVYIAQHTSLQKIVALKVMAASVFDTGSSARFDREMVALGKLNHPNVVTAFDAGAEADVQYIVTEYIEGIDIRQLVRQLGPLTPCDASRIASDAAAGLAHVHSQGLVHRDVKPSNVMLTADGQVKVLDLGLALLRRDDAYQLTQPGHIMGTFDYMAPEQWGDTHAVDARADVYSLGCSLFYMLAGRPPFGSSTSTSAEKMKAHLLAPSPSVASMRPGTPRQLDRLLHAMLAKDPGARPQTMADVIAGLQTLAQGGDLSALSRRTREPSTLPPVSGESTIATATRRPRRLTILACVVGIALAAGLAAWLAASGLGLFGHGEATIPPVGTNLAPVPPNGTTVPKSGTIRRHSQRVNGVAISPDGRYVVSAGEDNMMCVIDPFTHDVLAFDENHPQAISAIAFLASDKIATACADGKWRVWSLTPQGKLQVERIAPESAGAGLNFVRAVASDRLATGGWDNKVRLWTLAPDENRPTTFASSDAVYDAAASHDGAKLIWCGREGVVRCQDLKDNRLLHEWTIHAPEWVLSVDISADDRYAASAGWDDFVRVWNMESGEEIASLPSVKPKVVRFFPDGRRLAYAGRAGTVVIWDLQANKQVRVIEDQGPVDSLAIAPDGSYLVTGTDVGTVSIWPMP